MFKYFIYFFDKLKKFRSIIFFLFGLLNFNYLSITDLTWTNAISISASNPNFLYLNGATNATIITIDRINVYNTTLMRNLNNLIEFGDIETQADFTIIISNILFSNINFVAGGNMLSLQHQTANTMVIQNSVFQNIYGGSVTIESANKQRLDLPTKVWFQNLTANNLNKHLNSFIKVYLGADLIITDSVFSNIFNIQSGSVMYAGDQNSMTTFKNRVFSNNTSITGGVFNIEYNSLVILDGCSVFNNFAIQSGIIQINSNAHYQFFNSSFYHNYAISSSFDEIFDTSELFVISNWTIY